MATEKKFSPKKGFYGFDAGDADFLKPSAGSEPFSNGDPSGVGYNAKFDDATGVERGEQNLAGQQSWQSRGADDAAFLKASWTGDYQDAPHERLASLIDNEAGQPAGKMLGGGGPVSDNKVGGVGKGKIRYAPKTGPQGNLRKPR